MREEVRAGLDGAAKLGEGHGYAELTAGAKGLWEGPSVAFVRGEVGWKPSKPVTLFGYGEATLGGQLPGWQAGLGIRATW